MKEVTLYFTEGKSDKVYQVRLFESEAGFSVSYANAKRGMALNHKVKNQEPLTSESALKLFESTIAVKVKGGYTTDTSGTPFAGVDMEGTAFEDRNIVQTEAEHSGISPQLLTQVDYEEALRLCADPNYIAQQKHDGERRPIERSTDVKGLNKKGFYTALTPSVLKSAEAISSDSYLIDCEDMGEIAWAFDLLEHNGENISLRPYHERYELLQNLVGEQEHIKVVETAFTTQEKRDLMCRINDKNLEGIVFKRVDETYSAGRGGDQFKYKFFDEISVIVESISKTKRSVGMAVMDKGKMISVGKVTIPVNINIPEVGSIIEVKYLYAYKDGAMFTTSYLKPRNDVDAIECDISRLKIKPKACAS